MTAPPLTVGEGFQIFGCLSTAIWRDLVSIYNNSDHEHPYLHNDDSQDHTLVRQYKQYLSDIVNSCKDNEVKQFVATLLQDVENKQSSEEQAGLTLTDCNSININYGTQVIKDGESSKKRKVLEEPASQPFDSFNSSPATPLPADHDEAVVEKGIWECWKEVLQKMQEQDDVDVYSLERLNIIQIGKKLGSCATRKYYPKDLIIKTNMIIEEIPDYFVEDRDFYNGIFDKMAEGDDDASKEYLASLHYFVYTSNKPLMKFFYAVVDSLFSGLFARDSGVEQLEVAFKHYVIWPIITCLSKIAANTVFRLGETRLKAICEELRLVNNSDASFYNADGIMLYTEHCCYTPAFIF